MASFVLVHGSFHGAWCWSRFAPLLQADGHTVVAPNLPGSGGDLTPLAAANLASYAARIGCVIEAQTAPVILVGHSMGAIVSSQVAATLGDRLAGVVYVCGLLLRHGETLGAFLESHAHLGVEDLVLANMEVSDDGRAATFPTSKAASIFYNCCTAEDAAWAAGQLRAQATQVYADPVDRGAGRFDATRHFYVEARQDRAVSPLYQRAMVERTPVERVFTIDCDHSPFLSRPQELREALRAVAASVA